MGLERDNNVPSILATPLLVAKAEHHQTRQAHTGPF